MVRAGFSGMPLSSMALMTSGSNQTSFVVVVVVVFKWMGSRLTWTRDLIVPP